MDLTSVQKSTFQQPQIRPMQVESTELQLYAYSLPGLSKKAKAAVLEDFQGITGVTNGHIARVFQVYWTGATLHVLQEKVPCESLSQVVPTQVLAKQERKRMHFAEAQGWKFLHELALILSTLHHFGLPYVTLSLDTLKLQGKHLKVEHWFAAFLGKYVDSKAQGLVQAPEEHYEHKRDRKADVWAMGALLYRILAFKEVLGGEISTWPAAEKVNSLQHVPLPPCYSQKLSDLIIKMMYKRPENRITVAQVLSEVPLPFKLRYSPPPAAANLPEKPITLQKLKEKDAYAEPNVPLLKAPFRSFEVKSGNKEVRRRPWETYLQASKMRLNASASPSKRPSNPLEIGVEEPVFLSKTQIRGSSRLSSRESLSLSYERQPKRRSGSRPTIETLSQF